MSSSSMGAAESSSTSSPGFWRGGVVASSKQPLSMSARTANPLSRCEVQHRPRLWERDFVRRRRQSRKGKKVSWPPQDEETQGLGHGWNCVTTLRIFSFVAKLHRAHRGVVIAYLDVGLNRDSKRYMQMLCSGM